MPDALALLDDPNSRLAGKVLDQIERDLGGRDHLVSALLHVPSDPALDYVVGMIADPKNDCRNLSTICRTQGQISLAEVLEAFKRGLAARLAVKVMVKVTEAAPAIVDDVLTRAVVHQLDCERCGGSGVTPGFDMTTGKPTEDRCGTCRGEGTVTIQPDLAAQKFVLAELAHLGPTKAPQTIIDNSRTTTVIDASQHSYAKLLTVTDKLLYGARTGARASTEVAGDDVRSLPDIDAPAAPADTLALDGATEPDPPV